MPTTGSGRRRLHCEVDGEGSLRIGTTTHPDWLGPGRVALPDGVRLTRTPLADHAVQLGLEATARVGVASAGGLTDVRVGVRFDPTARRSGSWPAGMSAFGHQWTEFGLPLQSDEHLRRWHHLPFRPNVVLPLWLCAPDGTTILLAPLDGFHEQIVTFPSSESEGGLSWGWHGDLDEVPAGFSTQLAVLAGSSPRGLLEEWAALLGVVDRLPVDHDTLGRQVSYWTDNGAAYWYRTEKRVDGRPRSVPETLGDAVASVTAAGVEIGAVQLDSWFYPHEHTRPFDTDEWVVPPSGLRDWTPRHDILPEGIAPLRHAVGDRPLVAHCRHVWAGSPLVDEGYWVDGDYAHPRTSGHYERFLDRCLEWGVETFEHDWLVECWTGVRGLRAAPGRAREWQEGIDRAAEERGLTLQWCMATPADMIQTATLRRVTSIRTSGDHGYLVGPGYLWAWFCYTNALARALGLAPFKDVFLSSGDHAEVEALLSALSTGPIGVGDPIGATDPAVVAATCRADGTIVRPDVPVAATDASFRRHAVSHPHPLVAECHTDHTAGRWVQAFCANTWRKEQAIEGAVDLGPAWPTWDVAALDLRTGTVTAPAGPWSVALEPAEWTHHLLAPVLDHGIVVFGDVTKHAPVGRARIADVRSGAAGVEVDVAGPGETVTISGTAPTALTARAGDAPVAVGGDGRRWTVTTTVGHTPATIRLRPTLRG